MTIKKWKDIKEDFTDALLMGNGASIEFDKKFTYKSLWEAAKDTGHITDEIDNLAKALHTGTNFELLMNKLFEVINVNNKFDIKSDEIINTYKSIRKALINTVRENHCEYDDVKDRFNEQIPFLKNFNTIFSLNYDLLLYWIRIASDNKNEEYQFYDCFTKTRGFSDSYLRIHWEINSENQSTCVFYPHGALHLARDKQGTDKKIFAEGVDLLNTIIHQWSNYESLPLFVSEGDSKNKMASIKRSDYLLKVYNEILPKSGPTLVIYGWSMDKRFDEHILNQIIGGNYEKIAVHVHRPTTENINQFMDETNQKLKTDNIKEITYFEFNEEL